MTEEQEHPPTFLVSLVLLVPVGLVVLIWMTGFIPKIWVRFVLTCGVFVLAWRLIGMVEALWCRAHRGGGHWG